MWDTYLCLLLNIKHLLFHVHINVWSNTAQQISRCWHSLKAPREANTWHSSSREPCRWPGLDLWEELKTFCILSLVKSESPKIMERSVSLLPSAGGCKFHFVSALLSCDLVFAVHLPARQETREISEIIRPPPAQPIMRTITFEQEQERRKVMMMVMMDSLRQLWYVSTHCWRTFQLVWGETFDELYCQDTIFSSHEAIQFKYLPKSVCQGLWEISKEKSLKPKISRRLRPPTWFWVRLGGEGGR